MLNEWFYVPENNDLEKFSKNLKDLSLWDYDTMPGEPIMSDVTDNSIRLIIRVPKLGAIVLRATESDKDGRLQFEGVSVFTDEEICRG